MFRSSVCLFEAHQILSHSETAQKPYQGVIRYYLAPDSVTRHSYINNNCGWTYIHLVLPLAEYALTHLFLERSVGTIAS